MLAFSIMKKGVVCKNTNHSLETFFLPPFLFKEEDVIDNTHPQQIIVETLHHKMMVMLGIQPLSPMLCQVVPYLHLEQNDEHKER
jgi:hypothetical protein